MCRFCGWLHANAFRVEALFGVGLAFFLILAVIWRLR